MRRFILLFSLCLGAIAAAPMAPPVKTSDGDFSCYWMENTSGRFEWVPAEVGGLYQGQGYDRCFALDSCDGGLGESGGGCYKWARSASSARVLWIKVKARK